MVAELVRQNVGASEISCRTESSLELVEEPKIEVDSLIQWAIERTHHRLSSSATRISRVSEQHQSRGMKPRAVIRKYLRPGVLYVVQNKGYELDLGLFGCRVGSCHRRSSRHP